MSGQETSAATEPQRRIYESIIKVVVSDPPEKRAREIEEGLAYACALLHDEYGWDAQRIMDALENVSSGVEWDYAEDDDADE